MPMILTIKKEIGDIDLEIGQIVSYKKNFGSLIELVRLLLKRIIKIIECLKLR